MTYFALFPQIKTFFVVLMRHFHILSSHHLLVLGASLFKGDIFFSGWVSGVSAIPSSVKLDNQISFCERKYVFTWVCLLWNRVAKITALKTFPIQFLTFYTSWLINSITLLLHYELTDGLIVGAHLIVRFSTPSASHDLCHWRACAAPHVPMFKLSWRPATLPLGL